MANHEFQYDVAFSFVAQDESLATELADYFEGSLRVFLYSRKQEIIAGTDGEISFNAVFSEQCRLVVVLFRNEWGSTPWTRIEETAIRNRAYDEGYGFVMFIPIEESQNVPRWLPKTQLWIGLKRWGIRSAASVIDARIQELGGEPTEEKLEHRAKRTERALLFAKSREQYLKSTAGVQGATQAYLQLRDEVLASLPNLQVEIPSLEITERHTDRQIALLSTGPALLIEWKCYYNNSLDKSELEASIWIGHPPFPNIRSWEKPNTLGSIIFNADLDSNSNPTWSFSISKDRATLESKAAAQYILNWWLDKSLKQRIG